MQGRRVEGGRKEATVKRTESCAASRVGRGGGGGERTKQWQYEQRLKIPWLGVQGIGGSEYHPYGNLL